MTRVSVTRCDVSARGQRSKHYCWVKMKLYVCLHMRSITMLIAVILLCTASSPSNGARMLGVLGTASKSRYANMRNLADELVSRGHEVCYVICYS